MAMLNNQMVNPHFENSGDSQVDSLGSGFKCGTFQWIWMGIYFNSPLIIHIHNRSPLWPDGKKKHSIPIISSMWETCHKPSPPSLVGLKGANGKSQCHLLPCWAQWCCCSLDAKVGMLMNRSKNWTTVEPWPSITNGVMTWMIFGYPSDDQSIPVGQSCQLVVWNYDKQSDSFPISPKIGCLFLNHPTLYISVICQIYLFLIYLRRPRLKKMAPWCSNLCWVQNQPCPEQWTSSEEKNNSCNLF